ncbi:hypothetical protein [Actinomycetospora termitidis]|uniref:DUF7793 domain-containing protein n=1 Tax=Actinomycetospora termitidis TaxID=3053470 RepID=A0ABT7M7R7_9PSEU|nr:hypothetical protein [Actinomycetospora sp. Odt1-22]MDL5156239.1 hypothetical protein [Actinomycetospora sp. Odt1-22]
MQHDDAMAVREDPRGFLVLTWTPGLDIDGELADAAIGLIDDLNGDEMRPLLVKMAGTRSLSRDARLEFTRPCSVSRLALLGSSRVDSIIANFALGVAAHPMPMRFFVDDDDAVSWLLGTADPPSVFRWWRGREGARPPR